MPGKNNQATAFVPNPKAANSPNFWKKKKPNRAQTAWIGLGPPGFASQKSNVIAFPLATAQ